MAITLMYPWGPELHACSVDDALDGDGFGDSDFLDQGGRWVLNGKIIRARSLGLAGVRDGDTLIGQLSKEVQLIPFCYLFFLGIGRAQQETRGVYTGRGGTLRGDARPGG